MDLLTIFKALKARSFPFRILRNELNLKSMPSAMGWDRVLEKYETNSYTAQDIFGNDSEAYFEKLYLNHIYFGTKAVVIFSIEKDVALQLIERFSQFDYTDSPFQSKYPFPLNEGELADLFQNPIATRYENDIVFRVIYCAKRQVKIHETIDFSNLDSFDRNSLSEYEEIIGTRNVLFQSFDSIVIRPDEGRLEFHLDMSQPYDNSSFLNINDLSKTVNFYTNKINELLKDIEITLSPPMNFFPRIPKLYEEKDGYVHQLGHATGTESIKNEMMRDKKKMLDLRDELFHHAGITKLEGDTNCYSITKVWETENLGLPQLIIQGKFSQAGMPDASVTHAIIDGCFCQEDFEMVLSKLL